MRARKRCYGKLFSGRAKECMICEDHDLCCNSDTAQDSKEKLLTAVFDAAKEPATKQEILKIVQQSFPEAFSVTEIKHAVAELKREGCVVVQTAHRTKLYVQYHLPRTLDVEASHTSCGETPADLPHAT